MKRFGREIRRRRLALGLSLAELSERVGLTPNFIGTIEKGLRNPSVSTIRSLARGLEAPPAEFFTRAQGLAPPGLEAARMFEGVPILVKPSLFELMRWMSIERLWSKRRGARV